MCAYVSAFDKNSMYVMYCLLSVMLSAHSLRLMDGLQVKVGWPSCCKWQIAKSMASLLFLSESRDRQSLSTMDKDLVQQSVPRSLLTKLSPDACFCSSLRFPAAITAPKG